MSLQSQCNEALIVVRVSSDMDSLNQLLLSFFENLHIFDVIRPLKLTEIMCRIQQTPVPQPR